MTHYLITEPYDGMHVRVIASGRTPESAIRQYRALARKRRSSGHEFFEPIRMVRGGRATVHGSLDRDAATLPTWAD